jgi:hypothetical protein
MHHSLTHSLTHFSAMEAQSDPERVDRGLKRLIQLLLRTDDTVTDTDNSLRRARRLVRPASRDVASGRHSSALKLRMRRALLDNTSDATHSLNHSQSQSSGPSKVAELDRELDLLRRRHVRHGHSFLAVLEPLAFSASVADKLHMDRASGTHTGTHTGREGPAFSLLSQKQPDDSHTGSGSGSAAMGSSDSTSSGTGSQGHFRSDSLLPYGPPPILSDEVIQNINNDLVWVPRATEILLIRELLLIFQGINAPHIKLDAKTQSYVLHPELALPPPVRDLVLCMCETGWLYIKVKVRRVLHAFVTFRVLVCDINSCGVYPRLILTVWKETRVVEALLPKHFHFHYRYVYINSRVGGVRIE